MSDDSEEDKMRALKRQLTRVSTSSEYAALKRKELDLKRAKLMRDKVTKLTFPTFVSPMLSWVWIGGRASP